MGGQEKSTGLGSLIKSFAARTNLILVCLDARKAGLAPYYLKAWPTLWDTFKL